MTRFLRRFACTLLLVAPAAVQAQDAMAVLNAAAGAMNIEDVKTIRYTSSGSAFAIGQSFRAGGPYPRLSAEVVRELDLEGMTARQEFVNTRVDERGGGLPNRVGAEVRQLQFPSQNAAWPQHVWLWLNPAGFIKGAMKHNPVLTTERIDGRRYRVVTVRLQDRYTVRGLFNERNLMDKVETVLDVNPAIGDSPLDAVFTDYRDFGGILFPSRIVHYVAYQPSFDFPITSVTPNVTVNTTPPAPAPGAAPPAAQGGGAVNVTPQSVGRGIHYLTGGTHHSVMVEFADHVVVVDAPQNEARSLAVIAEVKRLAPGKPIRYVVNTHHHFDHSGGLRTYVDEGATIVTHPRNAAFYREWWSRPQVLMVDRLAQSGKTARFETVRNRRTFSDGTQTMEVLVVRDADHVEGMLVVYFPAENMLVEADLYTPPVPGAAPAAGIDPVRPAVDLVENIARWRIDVQRILPLHGPGMAARADLDQTAGIR